MVLARNAAVSLSPSYERHQPEHTLLYQLVEQHYPAFKASLESQGQSLPPYVQQEFDDFLRCGRLEYGFLRVRCEDCHHERLVAFSCKQRGFCPSCGARRMAESAALLVDEVLPEVPIRQLTPGMACSRAMQEQLPRVLSFPFQLRFLLARYPELMGKVLGIVYRTLSTHLIKKAGYTKATAQTGAVTLVQRFGSALNLNVHYHMLFLDGVYADDRYGNTRLHRVKAPTQDELTALVHTLSHRIARFLENRELLKRDAENTWLTLEEGEEDVLNHGVFAPNSQHRIQVTPTKRGKGREKTTPSETDWLDKTPEERHRAMSWMQRLKRVFNIDIETCENCGGQVKVIASIEDPAVIEHILKHLKQQCVTATPTQNKSIRRINNFFPKIQ